MDGWTDRVEWRRVYWIEPEHPLKIAENFDAIMSARLSTDRLLESEFEQI